MLLCLKAFFHVWQESTHKLAVIISIQSLEYYKFYLNQTQAGLASLQVGFAISGKEALFNARQFCLSGGECYHSIG